MRNFFNPRRVIYFFPAVALFLTSPAAAETTAPGMVYVTEGPSAKVYIAGSIHMLPRDQHPLPPPLFTAYEDSVHLVFEVEFEEMMRPEFLARYLQTSRLPEGSTLDTVLDAGAFAKLKDYHTKHRIPDTLWTGQQPWAVILQIQQLELTRIGASAVWGVDMHFTNLAKRDNKTISALETVDQQLALISSLATDNPDGMVHETIDKIDEGIAIFHRLIAAWRAGDSAALATAMQDGMPTSAADFDEKLLKERNRAWIPLIEQYIRGNRNTMVIVGAGHLAGDDNVLDLLKANGHPIRQVLE